MLAGFENPTKGKNLLIGRILRHPALQAAGQHDVSILCLVSAYDGENNIAFGLKQDGMAKSEIEDRVQAMFLKSVA